MWLDFSILLYTVLIVIGVKQPLGYQGTLDLIERRSGRRRTITVASGIPTVADQRAQLLASESHSALTVD